MPRSRLTEVTQHPSPRGPPSLRTSSSDSDPTHIHPRTERSPKLADGQSQRVTSNPKKLGTRIADLESQLGLAQEELKSLKNHLVSTEVATQGQLEKKSQKAPELLEIEENHSTPVENQTLNDKDSTLSYEKPDEIQEETDVFEVPTKKTAVEPKAELELPTDEDEHNPKSVSLFTESPTTKEPVNPLVDELASKNEQINLTKINLDEKEKELNVFRQENESLKSQLDEKSLKISSAKSEIDELNQKLNAVSEELEKSKSNASQMKEKLEATEKAKQTLDNEMKTLRMQTEQWRKAADAAASVLAEGVETNGRRISERCGSMDKLYCDMYNPVSGYNGYAATPGLTDDADDVFGGEKRKGMRVFGDLWKKKSSQR